MCDGMFNSGFPILFLRKTFIFKTYMEKKKKTFTFIII